MVDQIWVYGNSYESTLVAIVVPEKKTLLAWAKEAGVSGDFDVIAQDPKVCFPCTFWNMHSTDCTPRPACHSYAPCCACMHGPYVWAGAKACQAAPVVVGV